MPQDFESGIRGLQNGYNNADEIAGLIDAVRTSTTANLFTWRELTVVIKSGSSAVVIRNTLANVDSVVFGFESRGNWEVYRIAPAEFEALSVASQSSKHNENYRLVRKTQIRERGFRIYPPTAGQVN